MAGFKAPKPNILFLMCDSMDGRVVDPTSPVSTRLATPTFDSLAKAGVNFVRTYAASPQCVPSRTTMLTGRRTDQIRAFSNSNGLAVAPDGTVDPACASKYDAAECAAWGASQEVNATFFDSLVDAGYNVTVLGKVDVGADVLRRYPGATETGYDGDELSTFTRSADIRKPTKFFETNQHADEVFSASRQLDWTTIERCVEWLNSPTPAAAPWLLYCSLNIPHPPFNTNATWLASVNESLVDVPPWADPKNASARAHPYDAYMSISKAVDGAFTQAQIRLVRSTYYAMCVQTDYMLGRVLAAAKAHPEYHNTFVIFLSDHGEMNMEHRQVWKSSMYEASARVPLIVSGGALPDAVHGTVVTDLVSLLDVYPTLMSWAGAAAPSRPAPGVELSGTTLAPYLGGAAAPRADFVTVQYHSNFAPTGAFMIRHGSYKYIAFGTNLAPFAHYAPLLFDVDADPDELHDLASQKPQVAADLDAKLRAHLATGSNRVSSSGDYQEVDIYVKRQQLALYRQIFLNERHLDVRWQKLVDCVGSRPVAGFERGDDLERASCAANDAPLDLAAAATADGKLRQLFKKAYAGFDDDDWKKVQAWAQSKELA